MVCVHARLLWHPCCVSYCSPLPTQTLEDAKVPLDLLALVREAYTITQVLGGVAKDTAAPPALAACLQDEASVCRAIALLCDAFAAQCVQYRANGGVTAAVPSAPKAVKTEEAPDASLSISLGMEFGMETMKRRKVMAPPPPSAPAAADAPKPALFALPPLPNDAAMSHVATTLASVAGLVVAYWRAQHGGVWATGDPRGVSLFQAACHLCVDALLSPATPNAAARGHLYVPLMCDCVGWV